MRVFSTTLKSLEQWNSRKSLKNQMWNLKYLYEDRVLNEWRTYIYLATAYRKSFQNT